jgi:hypothetical protein
VPLRLVFEAPTIGELERALADPTVLGERAADLAERLDGLADDEPGAWLHGLRESSIVGDLVTGWRSDG